MTELERFSVDWGYTLESWKSELEDAQARWNLYEECE